MGFRVWGVGDGIRGDEIWHRVFGLRFAAAPCILHPGLAARFRVQGLEFRVQGPGFRVQGTCSREQGE